MSRTIFWGRVHAAGSEVLYFAEGRQLSCSTRLIINAAGPWVNEVARLFQPETARVSIELVQGSHIEVQDKLVAGDKKNSARDFFYLESPRDGRAVFVMPRNERLIIGTTETQFRSSPDNVRPHRNEENYLLGVLRHYFPDYRDINHDNLLAAWAGLRVLPSGEGHAFHKSRETILHVDRENRPRVLTVYGGKLTTYRATAEKVLERIAVSLPDRKRQADTRALPLSPD